MSKVERGTVNSQSDAHWAQFAPLEAVEIEYDSNGRPNAQKLIAAGTVEAVTHTSYDALGRVECVAQRMDKPDFGSSAESPCHQDPTPSSAFGPDRISKTAYDAAGQVTQQRTAVGTTLEAAEVTST